MSNRVVGGGSLPQPALGMPVRIRRVPNITLEEEVVRAFVLLVCTNQRRDEISSAQREVFIGKLISLSKAAS